MIRKSDEFVYYVIDDDGNYIAPPIHYNDVVTHLLQGYTVAVVDPYQKEAVMCILHSNNTQ